MALAVIQQPDRYSAAYLAIQYKFTSDLDPNTADNLADQCVLQGNSNSGNDVAISANVGLNLVLGDYVEVTNAGIYSGIHRVTSITVGTPGFNVTQFTIDVPVTTNTINGSNTILLYNASAIKYYNNYSAVIDVFIDSNFVVRLRKKRNFDNEFVFDLSEIVQEYLGSDLLDLTTPTSQPGVDISKNVYITYAEEYDVMTNGEAELTLTSFSKPTVDTPVFKAVNATIPYVFMNDFVISSTTYSLEDYYKWDTVDPDAYFLTQQPVVRLKAEDSYQLSFINNCIRDNGLFWFPGFVTDLILRVTSFDVNGNTLATNDVVIKNGTADVELLNLWNIPVGPANLGANLPAGTVKYTVNVRLTNKTISETKTFLIESGCNRVERRFEWVNKLGGIDAFTFTGKETRDIDIEKEIFKRSLPAVRTIPERQTTTFGVVSKDIYTVNSGIVSKEEKDWLIDLIESPEVYMVIGTRRLPIQVNDTFAFEQLTETAYNVTFEYEFAYDKIIQRN